jgi:hypothetical protein
VRDQGTGEKKSPLSDRGQKNDAEKALTVWNRFSPVFKPATPTAVLTANFANITEHMEVVSADGRHVGTVAQMEGEEMIKFTRDDSPDGHHLARILIGEAIPFRRDAR